jgi:hypothetical protein
VREAIRAALDHLARDEVETSWSMAGTAGTRRTGCGVCGASSTGSWAAPAFGAAAAMPD